MAQIRNQNARPLESPIWNESAFADGVREVLDHLYDSPYLQKHPFADLFTDGAVDPRTRSQTLRRIFLDAIEAMRPVAQTPAQSPDWRAYRILELRYLEGLTPGQTMAHVALAKSQFFREQARILEMLTEYLRARYGAQEQQNPPAAIDVPMQGMLRAEPGEIGDEGQQPPETSRAQLVQAEVARLCAHTTWQAVDLDGVLAEVEQVVSSVAAAKGVDVHVTANTGFQVPQADWVLLRQAILNVMTYGLDWAGGGRMVVAPVQQQNVLGIRICAQPDGSSLPTGAGVNPPPVRQGIGLLISQQLMVAMGGELLAAPTPAANENEEAAKKNAPQQAPWEARLIWRTDNVPVLLVIDDNAELIQLFQRYLSGYNWQVMGAVDGQQARHILEQIRPAVILLDVMMPQEDGWAILQWLKADSATATIPVVVCSVLNEPHLAQSLGADAYLTKPVPPGALLQTLARWWPTAAIPPSDHPASAPATE